jgi:FAD/FMN-containing dehydrogenase
VADLFAVRPYREMQAFIDAAFAPHLRYRWKSGFFHDVPDGLLDQIVEAGATRTSPLACVLLEYYGGAAGRVPADATAFPHRGTPFHLIMAGAWVEAAEDDHHAGWVRGAWEAAAPYSSGATYSNMVEEGEVRPREAYGSNLERLQAIKGRYDPANLLRHNTNVAPEPALR